MTMDSHLLVFNRRQYYSNAPTDAPPVGLEHEAKMNPPGRNDAYNAVHLSKQQLAKVINRFNLDFSNSIGYSQGIKSRIDEIVSQMIGYRTFVKSEQGCRSSCTSCAIIVGRGPHQLQISRIYNGLRGRNPALATRLQQESATGVLTGMRRCSCNERFAKHS